MRYSRNGFSQGIRFAAAFGMLTLATACAQVDQSTAGLSNQEFLEKTSPGPNVGGLNDNLLASADEALKNYNYSRAKGFYEQLLSKDARNVEYLMGYAETLRRSGQFDAALRNYNVVLEQQASHLDAREGKALSLMGLGKFNDAGQILTGIMKQDAKRWRTLNAIGILFAMQGRYREANAYYNEALKFSPDHPAVLNNIGLTQAMDMQYDNAIAALQRSSGLMPADSPQRVAVDMNLALVYGLSKRNDMAEKVLSRHLPKHAIYNNLGFYSYLANDTKLAKSYLDMALSQNPTYYDKAWNNMTLLQKDQGDLR
jgi:Flp pilus assembly protein TadD